MSDLYDLLIIGGGPAGLSAAMYAGRARLKTLVIEQARAGGQAATTSELENYPGFFKEATGPALMDMFEAHAKHFGAEFVKGQVTDVNLEGPFKTITLKNKTEYKARAVILAPGAKPRTLNIPGEFKLRGKGVSYCATCDADFFEDLDVAVVGNGDAAIEEAIYLTKFANSVTVIVLHDEGVLDCGRASAEKAFANPKLKWVWNSSLAEITGDEIVERITVKNIKTGELTELDVNGVFFFVGTVPQTEFLKNRVGLDNQGYIAANDMMETDVAGVYAAGDARVKYLRQVVTAASDGAVAAVAAEKYLAEMEFLQEQVYNAKTPVLLAFWAAQSDESVAAAGMLDALAAQYGGKLTLRKVDTYRSRKITAAYGVKQIPAALLFDGEKELARLDAPFTERDAKELIEKFI